MKERVKGPGFGLCCHEEPKDVGVEIEERAGRGLRVGGIVESIRLMGGSWGFRDLGRFRRAPVSCCYLSNSSSFLHPLDL